MKGIKNFINKHKKGCIIALVTFIILVLAFFTIFFVIPSFGNNNYGNRLDDIENHKISSSSITEIKDNIQSKEGVNKVTYHREGKILNFTINVSSTTKLEDAKEYASNILDGISKKNKKYYDIQIFLTTDDDSEIYPTAGYKHKTSDEIVWGNVGEQSE